MERPVGLRTLTARHLNKHHRKHNHFIVAYVPPLVGVRTARFLLRGKDFPQKIGGNYI